MAQPTSGRSDSPWSLELKMVDPEPIALPELAQDGPREQYASECPGGCFRSFL